ncbi:hypothetical protein [Spirulina subsalsa]|uniref:hypothetical protein n=1 Tax=Spirulina subsalsa TaxID=54311 RepID=UPI00030D44FA|nr:hypothetical protein [Spirulina subsalsa]
MNPERRQEIPKFESDTPEQFSRLEQLLAKAHPKLVGLDGEEMVLPESIYQILREVTPLLAQGKSILLYQNQRNEQRRQTLMELIATSQDLGFYVMTVYFVQQVLTRLNNS